MRCGAALRSDPTPPSIPSCPLRAPGRPAAGRAPGAPLRQRTAGGGVYRRIWAGGGWTQRSQPRQMRLHPQGALLTASGASGHQVPAGAPRQRPAGAGERGLGPAGAGAGRGGVPGRPAGSSLQARAFPGYPRRSGRRVAAAGGLRSGHRRLDTRTLPEVQGGSQDGSPCSRGGGSGETSRLKLHLWATCLTAFCSSVAPLTPEPPSLLLMS